MIQPGTVPSTNTLQELTMAAHFRAPLPLGVIDLAAWTTAFHDYPIIQQLPSLPPANLTPTSGLMPQVAVEFGMGRISLPRMLVRSPDGRYAIQLQGDRLAFGWSRIEPVGAPASYPGFDSMMKKWTEISSRFEAWTEGRFHRHPQHGLAEVSYANAAPLDRDGKRKRISEIFKFCQSDGRALTMFNMNWVECVYPDQGTSPPKGSVVASVGLAELPPAVMVLAFNFAGIATIADGQPTEHIMRDIHAKIREIYQSAVIPDGG
ncbi:MAG: hypothetical protein FWD68_01590 [Alphaproteobacteria bacterium]|nr:hypothetical protein [Alphaproteobacteria bacterium]